MTQLGSGAPNGREHARSGLALLLVMTKPAKEATLIELDRAIGLTLNPPPTPAQQRFAELGVLASLLNQIAPQPGWRFPRLPRKVYDLQRPERAPSSAVLVKRYGSWNAVCYAAYGLQPDGSWTGPGQPWPSRRGRPAIKPYTRAEVHAALRQCESELGRRPSQRLYERWSREKRRDARRRGTTVRLPIPRVIFRYYPGARGGWNAALRDAGLQA